MGFLNGSVKHVLWTVMQETPTDPNNPFFAYLDALSDCTMYIGNAERFTPRPATYFRLVSPYDYGRACPQVPIYSYSFALNSSSHQPSGCLNMSAVDGAYLRLGMANTTDLLAVRTYGFAYNLLSIANGLATLKFQQ